MADIRFEDKNNQKKTSSVFGSGVLTSANNGDTLFTLPEGSLVTAITVVESDGSGVGEGVVAGVAAGTYYPTGATVTISGITGSEIAVVEYVEVNLANGTYTD